MNDDHINWHGAFYDAIRLELEDYLDILTFEFEHQLNTDPLIIDALILKKKKQVAIEKNIAAIFKTTNVLEFKSPEDYLSISDFHKAIAYTHLYCATVQDAGKNTTGQQSLFKFGSHKSLFRCHTKGELRCYGGNENERNKKVL
ncbi:hypothetical protein AGMMS50255_1570 [Spirochaetia bacterium]|nr:hypothetical protein AGMMS50255_1570 [Spirochaetia bacterium]